MIHSVESVQSSGSVAAPEVANSSKASASEIESTSTFSSMDDLKKKAPKAYNQSLFSVASAIVKDLHNHDKRIQQKRAEARHN